MGSAKYSEDGVAQKFINGPAVIKNDAGHVLKIAIQYRHDLRWWQPLCQTGESANVGHHDGDFA